MDSPHLVQTNVAHAKRSFYELAKTRIKYRSGDNHHAFAQHIFGEDAHQSDANYVVGVETMHHNANTMSKHVTALEISVNKTLYDMHTDLLPYVIEHEIFESWLCAKRGYTPRNLQTRHLLARRREFELAMKDGKAEELLQFSKQVNPTIINELEYAYQKARRRHGGLR